MNDQLKQRLVGAIVLVALAVIFVPMLLQGNKRSGIPMFGSNVPAKPAVKAGEIDIPLQVPPPAPEAPATVVEQPVKPASATAAKTHQPVPAPAPHTPPPTAAATAAVKAPTKPVTAPAKPAAPPAEAWAVQVGSFGESRNALKMRDSLRAKGYPAYVERVQVDGGASYRVRVGPMLVRSDADALQGKLAAKLHVHGIVVHQP